MIWGLHWIDFSILMAFLVIILGMGFVASKTIKGQSDFFLGGRKMGKTLQFFMNFGNSSDPTQAPTMARQVYSQGVSGMWLQLQTLFFTPLFWFTQPWFRRARVITMADLFLDRFNSKSIASAYAAFNVIVALLLLGLGNLASFSVVDAMLVKRYEDLTPVQKESVDSYRELQTLRQREAATLNAPEQERLANLIEVEKRPGALRATYGYFSPLTFYIGYNLIIAIYIMMGGLTASAWTDSIQGLLILVMSVILIPIGLYQIGGFQGLHERVRPDFFWLSGTPASNFTWYSIAAVTFASFIQIIGLQHNMSAAGSARDENTARFGMIVGGFTKRLVLICWMLCGLLAVAIFSGNERLAQADLAWGALSSRLLPVGLIGIMLSGMLLGHMSSVGLTSIAVSGLVVRNLYGFVAPHASQKHLLRVSQAMVFVVLLASVAVAHTAADLQSLTTRLITFNTFFGAVVFLLFFWRRLTVPAILISFFIWMVLQLAVPLAVIYSPLRFNPALHPETVSRTRTLQLPAREADVAEGRAQQLNQLIDVNIPVASAPVFFEGSIAARDPANPSLGREGTGHFVVENFVLYYPLRLIGVNMENFSRADLFATRWAFAGLFPFFSLIVLSLLTPRSAPERAPAFYAKMKTPVAPTPELDHEEVEKSSANPTRWDHTKLFPGTNWEFAKWTREDFLGFFGCYAVVLVILFILWLVLHIGKSGPWF